MDVEIHVVVGHAEFPIIRGEFVSRFDVARGVGKIFIIVARRMIGVIEELGVVRAEHVIARVPVAVGREIRDDRRGERADVVVNTIKVGGEFPYAGALCNLIDGE